MLICTQGALSVAPMLKFCHSCIYVSRIELSYASELYFKMFEYCSCAGVEFVVFSSSIVQMYCQYICQSTALSLHIW